MEKKTDYLFMLLNVVSWIIFIGLGIDAGGFISNTAYTLFFNPNGASKFWGGLNLSELYHYDESRFVTITTLMIIVSLLKAIMFYLIVTIFHRKKLNLSNPFNVTFEGYLFNIAYLVLGIGLFSFWGSKSVQLLVDQGVLIPTIEKLKLGGADVWLFMGFTLLIFAKIFKKGIELQSENELTV